MRVAVAVGVGEGRGAPLWEVMFRACPVAMLITTLDGGILEANDAAVRLLDAGPALVGRTAVEMGGILPADREHLWRLLHSQGAVRDLALRLSRRSGDERDVLISIQPTELGGQSCLLATIEDVTDRKRAE